MKMCLNAIKKDNKKVNKFVEKINRARADKISKLAFKEWQLDTKLVRLMRRKNKFMKIAVFRELKQIP